MKILPRPRFGAREVLQAARRDAPIRDLMDKIDHLETKEVVYAAFAHAGILHLMPYEDPRLTDDARATSQRIYANRMLPKTGSARTFYTQLWQAVPDKVCAVCELRDIAEMDHVLPETYYPEFAYFPMNLVPICDKCNGTKLDHIFQNGSLSPFHPYFSEVGDRSWLHATVSEGPLAPTTFSVEETPTCSGLVTSRLRETFNFFGLNAAYANETARLLRDHAPSFELLLARRGPGSLREHLDDMAMSFSQSGYRPWQPVALRAWRDSTWFCNGGWRP